MQDAGDVREGNVGVHVGVQLDSTPDGRGSAANRCTTSTVELQAYSADLDSLEPTSVFTGSGGGYRKLVHAHCAKAGGKAPRQGRTASGQAKTEALSTHARPSLEGS